MRTLFAIVFIVVLFGIIECHRQSGNEFGEQTGSFGGEGGQFGGQGGRFGGQGGRFGGQGGRFGGQGGQFGGQGQNDDTFGGQNDNPFGGQNRPFGGRGRGGQGGRGGPRFGRGGSHGRNEFTPENFMRKLNHTEVFVSRYLDRAISFSTARNLSDVQVLQDIKTNDVPQFFNTLRQKLAPFVNITATPAPVNPLPVIDTNGGSK